MKTIKISEYAKRLIAERESKTQEETLEKIKSGEVKIPRTWKPDLNEFFGSAKHRQVGNLRL